MPGIAKAAKAATGGVPKTTGAPPPSGVPKNPSGKPPSGAPEARKPNQASAGAKQPKGASSSPSGQQKQPIFSVPLPQSGSRTDQGAGFLLGLLLWGWVILPFMKEGSTGVKRVLKAKFFNKSLDGKWLP